MASKLRKFEDYLFMRSKIDDVFDFYAVQSKIYQQANIARRLLMEDRFYHFTMELLAKIIGPFEIIVKKQAPRGARLNAKRKFN